MLDGYQLKSLSEKEQRKLVGKKVRTDHVGIGTVAVLGKNVMVKVILKCTSGKHKVKVFLTDAFTTGDLANVYNENGKWQGDFANSSFKRFCECK